MVGDDGDTLRARCYGTGGKGGPSGKANELSDNLTVDVATPDEQAALGESHTGEHRVCQQVKHLYGSHHQTVHQQTVATDKAQPDGHCHLDDAVDYVDRCHVDNVFAGNEQGLEGSRQDGDDEHEDGDEVDLAPRGDALGGNVEHPPEEPSLKQEEHEGDGDGSNEVQQETVGKDALHVVMVAAPVIERDVALGGGDEGIVDEAQHRHHPGDDGIDAEVGNLEGVENEAGGIERQAGVDYRLDILR